MDEKILVTGHKNPDTDSICSAIAYADFKNKQGGEAIPIRLGKISKETAFALEYFGVEKPLLLPDITPKVCNLAYDEPTSVLPTDSLAKAWSLLESVHVKSLGIVDHYNRLLGVVTVSDIAKSYIAVKSLRNKTIPKQSLLEVLDAEVLTEDFDTLKITGKVHVAAMTPEAMDGYIKEGDVLIVGNRTDTQLRALEVNVSCLIVTGGHPVDQEVIDLACEKGIIILVSKKPTFNVGRLLFLTLPVESIMTPIDDVITCNNEEYVYAVKDRMLTNRFASFPVIDAQQKLLGFISRYHLISPRRRKVILVDHNERSQSIIGLSSAEIIEIVDHHKIGDVQTDYPITFTNMPVGCTATIVASKYFETQTPIEPRIAGLLLSAIISDTLKFTSPTTTDTDHEVARRLAEIAEVDISTYALDLLKAGTSIEGLTPKQLFHRDFKIFEIAQYRFGVAQLNTMDLDSLASVKEDLTAYMRHTCETEGFDSLVLVLTNVLDQGSEICFEGSASPLIRQAFNLADGTQRSYLSGVVSRKKQIIPKISALIEK